jgi:inosine-uridine nucleoside N-ribohydrolase
MISRNTWQFQEEDKPEVVPLTKRRIILDTDPGGDDTFAILWLQSLVNQGLAELLAVTTTGGNVAARRTFVSTSQLLTLVGSQQVEVGRGVSMQTEAVADAAHIHGADGMGNLSHTLPIAGHDLETARDSDEILIDQLTAAPGEITLVAIAPLTNLAAAELKCPGILKKARDVVIMGGAFDCAGNITPHAEFNLFYNPEAAQTVFQSRDDSVVLPLDVTQHLIFTQEMAQSIYQINPDSAIAQFLVALCQFMTSTALSYRETVGVHGFLVHDAATLAALFYPDTLTFQRSQVQVETQGKWTRGQSLIDRRLGAKPNPNAWVAVQVDPAKFFTYLIEDLQRLVRTIAPNFQSPSPHARP